MAIVRTSEFADRLGVGRSTISQAMKGPLAAAKVGRGQIDDTHPCISAYVESTRKRKQNYDVGKIPRGRKPNEQNPKATEKKHSTDAKLEALKTDHLTDEQVERLLQELPRDIREIADMSLRDVIRAHGTAPALREYVTAVKYMEQTYKLHLENSVKEGELVARALLEAVIGAIDGSNKKLLGDGSKTIARRSQQKSLGGEPSELIEIFVRDTISKYLETAKSRIMQVVKESTK